VAYEVSDRQRVNKEVKRRTDVDGVFPTQLPCCDWPRRRQQVSRAGS
jgi:hypothetical protein